MDKCEGCPILDMAAHGCFYISKCHLDHGQQDNIRKAIAGEGRLWLVPDNASDMTGPKLLLKGGYHQKREIRWFEKVRQDQGGGENE